MGNRFEEYTPEEFIKLCFADDSGKYYEKNKGYRYRFWENFANSNFRMDVWKDDCPKIYNYAKSYDALPDPDVNSYNLYEAHIKVWNIQHKKFNNENIKDIKRHGRCRCEIVTTDEKVILGSDSIMSIYWHRNYGVIPKIMKNICEDKEKLESEINELKKKLKLDVGRCFNENFSLYKKFIWYYLQYANTIGGFMLFPRHARSINQARGCSDRIQDRFDLTLECIRRAYQYGDFYKNDCNPLFGILSEDKEFFRMFGTFENYAKFFCLNESYKDKHNWVTKDCSAVYNLLSNENCRLPQEGWISTENILPKDASQWWALYNNIMDRLEARNAQIASVLNPSSKKED